MRITSRYLCYDKLAMMWLKQYLTFILLLILSLLIGLRILGPDSDFLSYLNFYEQLSHGYSFSDTRLEYGFVIFSYLFKVVFNLSIHTMLVFLAFFSLTIKYFIIQKNKNIVLISFLYIISISLLHEMTQIRAAIAISFVLLSLYFKSQERHYLSVFLFFMSILFHYSMMFFLLVLLVPNDWLVKGEIRVSVWFLYAVLAAVVCYFIQDFLAKNIAMIGLYASRAEDESFSFLSVRFIGLFIPILLGLFSFNDFGSFQKRCFMFSTMAFVIVIPATLIPAVAHRLFEMGWVCIYFWVSGINSWHKKWAAMTSLTIVSVYFCVRSVYLAPIFGNAPG